MQYYRGRDVTQAKGHLRIDPGTLDLAKRANRRALSEVADWADPAALAASVGHYGILPETMASMNRPLGEETTISDILGSIIRSVPGEARYLEIGVSLGKTLWQVLHHRDDLRIFALEIEDINPPLAARLRLFEAEPFAPGIPSIRTRDNLVARHVFPDNGNTLTYIAGSLFDDVVWAKLDGCRFDVVFSDAVHEGHAILEEWRQITDRRLLDQAGFTMVWDDLYSPEMRHAFDRIARDAIRRFGLQPRNVCFTHVCGWIGRNDPPHPVGIISSHGFVA
ncbi:hypothetical protein [Methylobacterium nigriterrae]|uniref:hypothetical protein n=1 Tax=Methylobacterium nigriterrae TaxID=3127512 RepID=UPI003013340E